VHKYTPVEIRFLEKKVTGRSFACLTELFNKRFGLALTCSNVRAACHNRGLTNGRDTCFRPGMVPHNKGRKGCCPPGCEKGWFQPGQMPFNTMPLGSERISKDEYAEVKYSEKSGPPKNRWKGKHVLIWEKANGPVPKGHAIIFADGNRLNMTLKNLLMVSRAELAVMNRLHLISAQRELTKTGKAVADIKLLIAGRKRGIKKRKKSRQRSRV
jgi:hypothetical protein